MGRLDKASWKIEYKKVTRHAPLRIALLTSFSTPIQSWYLKFAFGAQATRYWSSFPFTHDPGDKIFKTIRLPPHQDSIEQLGMGGESMNTSTPGVYAEKLNLALILMALNEQSRKGQSSVACN